MTKKKGLSESSTDKLASLALSQTYKVRLFRNNVGAFQAATGQWVRYGLANDSKQMNQYIKSGDRIGWTPIEITPEMVGKTIAVFTSIEMKEEGYKPKGKAQLAHYEAQERWAAKVREFGGIAGIVDSAESACNVVKDWLKWVKG